MSIEDPLPGWDKRHADKPPELPLFELLVDEQDDESPRYMVVDGESTSNGAWITAEAMLSLCDWQ